MKHSKTKLVRLFPLIVSLIIGINSLQAQNQENWQYMGRVFAYYSNGDEYNSWPHVSAQLYSSFDGEKVTYKLIVGNDVYTAYANDSFSQSQYDNYLSRLGDDHFHGPHLKNKQCYPYCAGKYYFNPAYAHTVR